MPNCVLATRPPPITPMQFVYTVKTGHIINNAIKYNDKDKPIIEIGCLNEGDNETGTIFYVKDNGIGIKPEHQDKIWRIFKRLHTHNEYGGGTGSGLTHTKKIIERSGGEIWVESEPNIGSVFYWTLNVEGEDEAKEIEDEGTEDNGRKPNSPS